MNQRDDKVTERRTLVAVRRLAGEHNQRDIARALGVSQPTIHRDFIAIDEEWRKEWADSTEKWKTVQAERIEALLKAIWANATRVDGKAQNFYIDRAIALLDRQAKLLGLDAPTKINIIDDIRRRAIEAGLDPDAAVEEANRILAGVQA